MPYPIWITYAWSDNASGDFDYLVSLLAQAGIKAKDYRIALAPGQRMWDRIASEIHAGDISGWAYLVTRESLASESCREELFYALDRVLSKGDWEFPVIGLV